jgi:hypothetical protein
MGRLPDLSGARGATISGFLWGLAEATVFFIVPDVLLCCWALKSARDAVTATLASVVGSMFGAMLLYAALIHDGDSYRFFQEIWEHLPGFKIKMAEVAAAHLRAAGAAGLTSGPASGIPYRVYVLEAWKLNLSLGDVLLCTPIARLERIVLAPVTVLALRFITDQLLAPRFRRIRWSWMLATMIAVYWIVVYLWYWGRMVPHLYG